ncbi:MAG: hypothetical protein ABI678_02665 [Kofleriaceae bacterium]
MRSSVLIAMMLLASATAHADGVYYSEEIGATHVKDELAAHESDTTLLRMRVAAGYRRGPLAYEIGLGMHLDAGELAYDGGGARGASLGAVDFSVKYLQPIARHLELYVRGSASYGWADGALADYAGRGLGFGAGIQLKGKGSVAGLLFWPLFFIIQKGPMMTAALFVDEGYEFYRLHPGGDLARSQSAVDAQLSHFTMGFALGTDF